MKRITIALPLMALMAAAAVAQPPRYDKMSPLVRRAAMWQGGAKRLLRAGGDRLVCVFMAIDPAAADSLLEANGCRIYDVSGDIVIASVPASRLAALSASPAVGRIEASGPCRLAMDTTATIVNAMPVYSGAALPQAFTGRGVVVGVMDVGFDLTHPTFYDSTATNYRICAFWDQLDRDAVGSALPVGRDYVGTDALMRKLHSADGLAQTHGTHTLGIAAGSGYDSPYRGMAFESDICLVSNAITADLPLIDSADVYKYTSATDALGFKYIFDYAASRGMPCVVSFSEGYVPSYGSEDSLYSRYLERLVGPGRILVASAGNESVSHAYVDKPRGMAEAGSFLYCTEREAGFFVQTDGPSELRLLSYGSSAVDTISVPLYDCQPDSTMYVSFLLSGGRYPCTAAVSRYASAFGDRDNV